MKLARANMFRHSHISGEKIDIGGRTPEFKPQVKIWKWDEECALDLILETHGTFMPSNVGERIFATNNDIDFEFHPTPIKLPFNDAGGIDLFFTLKKKPQSNKLNFGLDLSMLDAFHQPPDSMCYRPDHVINSVAFYHKTKSGIFQPVGSKYKTGKFGHLYRPKIVDSLGAWAWCDWELNGNVLTLVCPKEFIKLGIYPLTIEPVGDLFGYNTIGGSWSGGSGDSYLQNIVGSQYTGAAGTLVSMAAYVADRQTVHATPPSWSQISGVTIGYGLYEDGVAGAQVDLTTPYVGGGTPGAFWNTQNFPATPATTTVQEYWLYGWGDGNCTYIHVALDTTGGDSRDNESHANSWNNWPADLDDADFPHNDVYRYSIIVNFTPDAPPGWSAGKTFNGVATSTIKNINGVALADIKKVNGV